MPDDLRIMPIAVLAAGGRWRVEAMRAISEPCLLWFTKGQGRITLQGQTRGYTAHNCIFIPAGVTHGFEVSPSVFGTALFFGRDHGLDLPKEPLHLRIREANLHQELTMLLDHIQRELASDAIGKERAARHYLGLLDVFLERQSVRQSPENQTQDASAKLVARFTALIEEDFRSGAGVAELAEKLGVTPTHLTRCCQAISGRPALTLLQDRRLIEARRLLSDTKLAINQIASDIGFGSPAYFTRAFHLLTGKSPSDFRRAAQPRMALT